MKAYPKQQRRLISFAAGVFFCLSSFLHAAPLPAEIDVPDWVFDESHIPPARLEYERKFIQRMRDEAEYRSPGAGKEVDDLRPYFLMKLRQQKPLLAEQEKQALARLREANRGLYDWPQGEDDTDACYFGWEGIKCNVENTHVIGIYLTKGLRYLPPKVLGQLHQLKTISLTSKANPAMGVAEFAPGVFDGLNDLESLHVDNYQGTTLAETLLNDLVNLESLHVDNYQGTTLPETLLNNLVNLKRFGISRGKLATLPARLLSRQHRLASITITYTALQEIPPGFFDHTENLGSINFSDNQLRTLPEGFLSGIRERAGDLVFHNNALTRLPTVLSYKPITVNQLVFHNNQLTEIPQTLLHNIKIEYYVGFGQNLLSDLPTRLFRNQYSLRSLSLDKNRFSHFPQQALLPLSNLWTLSIDDSLLQDTSVDLCHTFPKLERVNQNYRYCKQKRLP